MWSLNSQQRERTSGPENFWSSAKKDFFNTIGAKRTSVDKRQKQAGGMHVVPIGQNEHMHCSNPAREVARNPTVAVVGLKDPGSYLR